MAACEAGHLLELTSDSCTEDFGASIALLRQVEQHSLRRRGGKNLIIRDRNPFTSARTPRSSAGFTPLSVLSPRSRDSGDGTQGHPRARRIEAASRTHRTPRKAV